PEPGAPSKTIRIFDHPLAKRSVLSRTEQARHQTDISPQIHRPRLSPRSCPRCGTTIRSPRLGQLNLQSRSARRVPLSGGSPLRHRSTRPAGRPVRLKLSPELEGGLFLEPLPYRKEGRLGTG